MYTSILQHFYKYRPAVVFHEIHRLAHTTKITILVFDLCTSVDQHWSMNWWSQTTGVHNTGIKEQKMTFQIIICRIVIFGPGWSEMVKNKIQDQAVTWGLVPSAMASRESFKQRVILSYFHVQKIFPNHAKNDGNLEHHDNHVIINNG